MKKRFLFYKFSLIMLLASFVISLPKVVVGEQTDSAEGSAFAKIKIEKIGGAELNFGEIVPNPNINVNGLVYVRINGSTKALHASFTGLTSLGKFKVTGEASKAYNISHSLNASLVNETGDTIIIRSLWSSPRKGPHGQLNEAGKQVIFVAGALPVSPTQAAGTYTGTYNITVSYK